MALYTASVHNKLIETFRAGPFHSVKYNAQSREMEMDESSEIAPKTCVANEINSSFALSTRNRQSFMRERTSWRWLVKLGFNQQVSSEAFEEALLAAPVFLDRPEVTDKRARFDIVEAEYRHPPQQQPNSGTSIEYDVSVVLTPS